MATNIQYKSTDYMISGWVTPEVKVAEGFDSVGRHHPAPFLPLIRLNQEQNINVVISRNIHIKPTGLNKCKAFFIRTVVTISCTFLSETGKSMAY